MQSEIEIIKSQDMAYRVVDRLNLDENEAFLSPPVDATDQVIDWLFSLGDPLVALLTPSAPEPAPEPTTAPEDVSEDDVPQIDAKPSSRDRAAGLLRDRLSVSRSGRSFVIQIGVQDFEPVRAALIARVYGSSYERFQLEANRQVAGNAAEWLQERLDVLNQQSLEAASAVQEFRAANDLTQVRGSLLTEQQQSELATELVAAAANSAEKKAQLDSMESLLERASEGEDIVTVPGPDGREQELTTELRRDYQNVRLRYGSLLDQFGPDHPQVQELERRMEDLRDALRSELVQATEGARIAFNAARSREESLRQDLEGATSMSDENVAVRGRLQQLESISDTYEEVYRQYLGRYQVAVQQQGFPIASVDVISRAEVPTGASSPRKKALLVAGAFLGGLIGMMIAAVRELGAKPVRTPSTLRKEVGIDCAGLLPSKKRAEGDAERRTRARTLERLALSCEQYPSSSLGILIGIAPLTNDDDGDDALAEDLAAILTRGDRRSVLLIGDKTSFDAASQQASPSGGVTRVSMQAVRDHHDGQVTAENELQDDGTIVSELRESFDFVLFQMPPLSQSNRSDANSRACDIAILRVPWGRVLPGFVSDALKDNPTFEARLSTAVLEGADLRMARRYMGQGSYEERETYA